MERERESEGVSSTVGFADRVGDDFVGMFAHQGRAYVFVNDACWDVETDDLRVVYRRVLFVEVFRLTRRGEPIYRKTRVNWSDFRERLADPTTDRIDELGTWMLDAIATLLADRGDCREWAARLSRADA